MSPRAQRWVPFVLALCCLGPRLPGLTLPLLEEGHAWRQSVTAMVARNFHRHGYRLAWPELDLPPKHQPLNTPGYTNSEFPLFPWLVACGYAVTGVQEWVGRLLAALCTVGAMLCLFALVRRLANDWAAIVAAACFALNPMGIYFTRAFLPEPLMLLCLALGMWQLVVWAEDDDPRAYWLGLVAVTLAPMIKQPALYLLPALACAGLRSRRGWRDPRTWLLVLLPPLATSAWYAWAGWLGKHYTEHFAVGGGAGLINPSLWVTGAVHFYPRFVIVMIVLIGSVTGWPLALLGLRRPRRPGAAIAAWWLAGALGASFIANGATISHYYYNLGLLLPLAALIGYGSGRWDRPRLRWITALLVLWGPLAVLSFGQVQSWYNVRPGEVAAAAAVRRLTPRGAYVYTICYGTQLLYACDRRGEFLLPDAPFLKPEHLEAAARAGYTYLATGRREAIDSPAGEPLRRWLATRKRIAAGPGYLVYDLRATAP